MIQYLWGVDMKKYEFTGKETKYLGVTLKQIVCVTAFGFISVGDIGGYIESECNLSHLDNAWVFDSAMVFGNALVSGNVRVFDNARVFENAIVSGDAEVSGYAEVSGDARVFENAIVSGNARVSGSALVFGSSRVLGNALVFGNAEVCTLRAFTVSTNMHHVTITDTHITIGCQSHKIDFWRKSTPEQVEEMCGKESAENFIKYKDFILMLADQRNQGIK